MQQRKVNLVEICLDRIVREGVNVHVHGHIIVKTAIVHISIVIRRVKNVHMHIKNVQMNLSHIKCKSGTYSFTQKIHDNVYMVPLKSTETVYIKKLRTSLICFRKCFKLHDMYMLRVWKNRQQTIYMCKQNISMLKRLNFIVSYAQRYAQRIGIKRKHTLYVCIHTCFKKHVILGKWICLSYHTYPSVEYDIEIFHIQMRKLLYIIYMAILHQHGYARKPYTDGIASYLALTSTYDIFGNMQTFQCAIHDDMCKRLHTSLLSYVPYYRMSMHMCRGSMCDAFRISCMKWYMQLDEHAQKRIWMQWSYVKSRTIPHIHICVNQYVRAYVMVIRCTFEQKNGTWYTGDIVCSFKERGKLNYRTCHVVNGTGDIEYICTERYTNPHHKDMYKIKRPDSIFEYVNVDPLAIEYAHITIEEPNIHTYAKLNALHTSTITIIRSLETLRTFPYTLDALGAFWERYCECTSFPWIVPYAIRTMFGALHLHRRCILIEPRNSQIYVENTLLSCAIGLYLSLFEQRATIINDVKNMYYYNMRVSLLKSITSYTIEGKTPQTIVRFLQRALMYITTNAKVSSISFYIQILRCILRLRGIPMIPKSCIQYVLLGKQCAARPHNARIYMNLLCECVRKYENFCMYGDSAKDFMCNKV